MKSFNGLYTAMMEQEEIKAAIIEAAEHKKRRARVRQTLENLDDKAKEVHDKIESGNWEPKRHDRKRIQEGSHKKERTIEKPEWDDEQIVHHMLIRQFRKIFEPRAWRYSCGSIPGRGPLFAMRTMCRWERGYKGRKHYIVEGDVKGFYDNVDLENLKAMLRKFIRDKRYLAVLFKVIDTSSPGLPKGFYTSPWLGNFYLTCLDYFIVQVLKPDHYLRYMDNIFLWGRSKKEMHRMLHEIETYLGIKLHLELNGSKQVYRMEQPERKASRKPRKPARRTGYWVGISQRKGNPRPPPGRAINCLGYVIHCDRVTMRKGILKRSRAKANRMHRLHRCRRIDAAAMLSYKGWYKHTDTYGYFQTWIKPKVSIRYCRKRISILAKRQAERMKKTYENMAHCA